MTVYKEMSDKITMLIGAAIRCMNANKKSMALMWMQKADLLEERLLEMPIGEAVKNA